MSDYLEFFPAEVSLVADLPGGDEQTTQQAEAALQGEEPTNEQRRSFADSADNYFRSFDNDQSSVDVSPYLQEDNREEYGNEENDDQVGLGAFPITGGYYDDDDYGSHESEDESDSSDRQNDWEDEYGDYNDSLTAGNPPPQEEITNDDLWMKWYEEYYLEYWKMFSKTQ